MILFTNLEIFLAEKEYIILLFFFTETVHHTCANVTLSVMVMLIHGNQTRSSRRHLNDRQLQETITSEMRGIGHVTL